MKKTNKILSLIMAVLLMCLSMVCVSAEDSIIDDESMGFFEDDIVVNELEETIEVCDGVGIDGESMPTAANACPNVDATTLHELFDNLHYSYEGSGNKTVLTNGYTYTTHYSHNYINVNIYEGDNLIDSYRILTIG